MRTRGLFWSVLLFAGCSFHAQCGGDKTLDRAEVEAALRSSASDGLTFTKVTCPDKISSETGSSFECQIEVDGRKTYPMTVTIASTEGGRANFSMAWKQRMLGEDQLREHFRQNLTEEFGPDAQLDCGEPLVAPGPDHAIHCQVVVDGQHLEMVGPLDDQGTLDNVTYNGRNISTAKLDELLTPVAREKLGEAAVVSCGPPRRKLRPADGMVWCKVTVGDQELRLRLEIDEDYQPGKVIFVKPTP